MDTNNRQFSNNIFKPFIIKIFHKNWIVLLFVIAFHLGLIYLDRIIALVSLWLITILLLTNTGKQFIYLGKPGSKSWYLTGPLLGLGMVGLSSFLCWAILGWQENNLFVDMAKTVGLGYHMLGENAAAPARIAFLLFAWLIGPFLEELLFRGYIQSFTESISGTYLAILVQAVLFALIHPLSGLSWPISIFAAGILYGWIRLKSQSIWPAVLAHAAYNTGILVTSFAFLPHLIYGS